MLQPLLGIAALLGIAWLLSSDRAAVRWRPVLGGLGLQWILAFIVLRTAPGHWFFDQAQAFFLALLDFAKDGAGKVIGDDSVGVTPGSIPLLGAIIVASVVFFSSVFTVLHYLGVVRLIVGAMARLMARTLHTSGAESTSAAANIFVGQTEAPLLVRPYLATMTRSEIGTVMTVGFATIAGGVFGVYISMMQNAVPGIAGHLLSASVMSAPMGLGVAKILFPETGEPETLGTDVAQPRAQHANLLDAAASGAADGMKLSLNILGMLIAFLGLLALANAVVGWAWPGVTLQMLFGGIFAPLAWLLGVPAAEAVDVGSILGTKIAVNEYVAFDMLARTEGLSERSLVVASYALCGFANFSSIAIQIGGLGGICPERRGEFAQLGLRAMAGGAITSFLTAATAAILLL